MVEGGVPAGSGEREGEVMACGCCSIGVGDCDIAGNDGGDGGLRR